jgi:hypothetical protein
MWLHGRAIVLLVSTRIQGIKADEIDPDLSKVNTPTKPMVNSIEFFIESICIFRPDI